MNRKDEHVSLARAFHQQPKENDFDAVRLIHLSSLYYQKKLI